MVKTEKCTPWASRKSHSSFYFSFYLQCYLIRRVDKVTFRRIPALRGGGVQIFVIHKISVAHPGNHNKNKLLAHYECQLDWLWNLSPLRMPTSMTVGSRRTKHTSSTLLLFGVPRNSARCKETSNAFAHNIYNCPGTSKSSWCIEVLPSWQHVCLWCVSPTQNVLHKIGQCSDQPETHTISNILWFGIFTHTILHNPAPLK